ncbi:MAG: endolytic transglycosylase MltG [Rhodothalassiaceae bacterium]
MPRLRHLAGGLFLAGLILALFGLLYVWTEISRPGPAESATTIVIDQGAGAAAISVTLQSAGLVRNSRWFRLAARMQGASGRLHAGEFAVPPGLSALELVEFLATAKPIQRKITVPEGLTSTAIVALLEAEPLLRGAVAQVPPEGSLLPETYYFTRGESRQALLDRMAAAQQALLETLWPRRVADLPLDSPQQAVILASIVEKETGMASERPAVAAVFVNRLRLGMRLQSDPTVIYGLTEGAPLGRRLLRADLDVDSAYNTYRRAGLPPGPIANPGRASIEAVLNPAQSDHLYFVANGEGGHAFARTLEEHNRNVARWRRIRRSREMP